MENNINTSQKPHFSLTWKALTLVISLLILYTAYHVIFGLVENPDTTHAGLVEQKSSLVFQGVIFRDEEVIATQGNGYMRPYSYDGERVSVDSVVASVYTKGGNSDLNAKIAELEEKLDILKKSNVNGLLSIVDIESIKADIDDLYITMMSAISSDDLLRAKRAEKELIIAMNKLEIYRGNKKDYNTEIAEIERELDECYDSYKGDQEYIYADKGGYFYHSCDGYEELLTLDMLESITVSELSKLTDEVKDKLTVKSQYIAKFVYNNVWNIAVLCDNAMLDQFEEGKIYSAEFFDVRSRELDLTLEKIGESDGVNTVLVFSCTYMPEGFDYTRYQEFTLDLSFIEGYRVPKEAVVTVKDKKTSENKLGVYVLEENTVVFRKIEVIGEAEGYYIVAKRDKNKENYSEYLNLNDLIILDNKGMYDGKTIKR